MPLAYAGGTIAEHRACREDSVVFDVSHLGTVRVEGPDAVARLQAALSNDLRRVAPGRAQYTHLLDEADGSVVDDIIVWWLADEVFDVMPNASNTDRVVQPIGGEDTTSDPRHHRRPGTARPDPPGHRRPRGRRRAPVRVAPFVWEGVPCARGGHRLHRRGRCGAGRARRRRRRPLDGPPRHRYPTGRTGGPGHPPPRGGASPARPRARTRHHPAAGRPGAGWSGGTRSTSGDATPSVAERLRGVRRRLAGLATEGRQPPRQGSRSPARDGRWAR